MGSTESQKKRKFALEVGIKFIAAGVVLFGTGLAIFASSSDPLGIFPFKPIYLLVPIVVSGAFVALMAAALKYLEPPKNDDSELQNEFEGCRDLQRQLPHVLERIDALEQAPANGGGMLTDADRAQLVQMLHEKVRDSAVNDYLEHIRSSVAMTNMAGEREREIQGRMEESRSRLLAEIKALGRRGNLNLVLGMSVAMMGVLILGVSVVARPAAYESYQSFLLTYLPKISLVILVEIFAYFFLRLYKGTLAEIKYFQNELTNMESKHLAVRIAHHGGEAVALNKILLSLGEIERNHVLVKGETTVELEKLRYESMANVDMWKLVSKLASRESN